ncbi:MAG: type II toxin-antitoxin system VapC family toxin [Brevundimonas sp.]|uniref:type II toxin-antitoxin system VapC family toxin n=1 Tax=Brevundimonas sp. TaxID=1871086 RepID=UPI002732F6B3|nr:type II toxin-antitoxin system VapC family toxin [Brevundimonas sp.]MDP3403222.1 type II toxin-antitoxin system VapC family toxin [Brevundimonas sp.]
MPSSAICDASVAVRWLVDDPLSQVAIAARRQFDLKAPWLMMSETANALRNQVKAGFLPLDIARRHLEGLPRQIELRGEQDLMPLALTLAVQRDHAAYDCVYVAMALTLSVPLVTGDARLARKFCDLPGLEMRTLQDWVI